MTRDPERQERLLRAALAAQDADPATGKLHDREAGLFDPASLAELEPYRRALRRGTRAAKLRTFAARCPGPRSHLLCEVVAPGVLLTQHYLLGDFAAAVSVPPEDHEIDRRRGRVRIEPRHGQPPTVPAAAVLAELTLSAPPTPTSPAARQSSYRHGRSSLLLRCCMIVTLETQWIAEQVRWGEFRETVVPVTMLERTTAAEVAAEMDDDTPQ